MITKITLFITLLAYSVIVSQSFMYILALKQVQFSMEAGPYTELRKLIDISMRGNFKYAIYAGLLFNLILIILTIKNPSGLLFITTVIAFVTLIIDTWLTLKGNLPINDIINTWSPDHLPANWKDYRAKWFTVFQYRQLANITGFISLLIGTVFGSK